MAAWIQISFYGNNKVLSTLYQDLHKCGRKKLLKKMENWGKIARSFKLKTFNCFKHIVISTFNIRIRRIFCMQIYSDATMLMCDKSNRLKLKEFAAYLVENQNVFWQMWNCFYSIRGVYIKLHLQSVSIFFLIRKV